MTIRNFINRIAPLPIPSEDRLISVCKEVRFPKGSIIMKEHGKTFKAYVIKEGIAHAYAIKDGKAATFWIGQEGDVIHPGPSLHSHSGEYGTVELLEDSILYELDLIELNELYLSDIQLANWGRLAAEKACISIEKSILSRQFQTTLERYEELLQEFPDIVRRVPLHVIASYLNTSQENLSRIRRKVR